MHPAHFMPLPSADGSGGWGGGLITAIDGSTVSVASGLVPSIDARGGIAVIVSGPGSGQWRSVVSRPNNSTLVLSAPLDAHAVIGESLLAVIFSSGGKIVVGNNFSWGSKCK
jgi:hypothetical protein